MEGPVDYKQFEKVNYCSGRVNALTNLYAVKGMDWQYEQEYRIAAFDLENDFVDFHPDFLVGIILGMKVDNSSIVKFCEEIGYDHASWNYQVAIKSNECLQIIKWPGPTMDTQGITIHVLSSDPTMSGFFERLFAK